LILLFYSHPEYTQFLKDWHLMITVLIFVILDVIILTTVTAIDSSRYTVMSVRDRENPDSVQNVSESILSFSCSSSLL